MDNAEQALQAAKAALFAIDIIGRDLVSRRQMDGAFVASSLEEASNEPGTGELAGQLLRRLAEQFRNPHRPRGRWNPMVIPGGKPDPDSER